MTLVEVAELGAYWAEHPPVHLLLAAYLGAGLGRRGRAPALPGGAPSEPEAVLGALAPGLGAGDIHAGLAPVVLDFAELRRRQPSGH